MKVSTEGMYVLRGGGLPFDAKPAQLHFHWGTTPERGSEHTIDGRAFSAEVIMTILMTILMTKMMILTIMMILLVCYSGLHSEAYGDKVKRCAVRF